MRTVAELEKDSNTTSESLKRIAVAKSLVELILGCHPNIYELRLFGSVARGQATEKSDIDLSIITKSLSLGPAWNLEHRLYLTDEIGTLLQREGYRVMAHYQRRARIQIPNTIDFGVYTDTLTTNVNEIPPGPKEEQVILFKR